MVALSLFQSWSLGDWAEEPPPPCTDSTSELDPPLSCLWTAGSSLSSYRVFLFNPYSVVWLFLPPQKEGNLGLKTARLPLSIMWLSSLIEHTLSQWKMHNRMFSSGTMSNLFDVLWFSQKRNFFVIKFSCNWRCVFVLAHRISHAHSWLIVTAFRPTDVHIER